MFPLTSVPFWYRWFSATATWAQTFGKCEDRGLAVCGLPARRQEVAPPGAGEGGGGEEEGQGGAGGEDFVLLR